MLATLRQYQDQMWAITEASEVHLRHLEPDGIAELGQHRMELAQVMTSYQLFVHREVFEPLIRTGTAHEAAHAREMKAECILLAEEFRAFAHMWTTVDVATRWRDYRVAGLDFMRRIRSHIERVRHDAPSYLTGRRPAGLAPVPTAGASPIGRRVAA